MKQFASQKLIIEMSQRELEMIQGALINYSNYWYQRASNTLAIAENTRTTCRQLGDQYNDLYLNVTNLLESLPF